MEHNYEVKTSNRVLTVATGVMGEKQKIFYRLGVFFFCYISGHRAGREWTRVDQGARLRDVLNITLQSSFLGCSDKVLHWLHYSLNWPAVTSFTGDTKSPPTENASGSC